MVQKLDLLLGILFVIPHLFEILPSVISLVFALIWNSNNPHIIAPFVNGIPLLDCGLMMDVTVCKA
jgi:hypothetical protein